MPKKQGQTLSFFRNFSPFCFSPKGILFFTKCLIGLLFFNFSASLFAQNNQKALPFEVLGLDNGLSQSTVNTVLQDNFGFIWVGTQDGLNRFDGYDFKIFRHTRRDKNSIRDNHVRCLFLDTENLIWVGTDRSGAAFFDHRKQGFTNFGTGKDALSGGEVHSFSEDKIGRIWIGTNAGISIYNKITGKFSHLPATGEQTSNLVSVLVADRNGDTWVGTSKGLGVVRAQKESIEPIDLGQEESITALYSDNLNLLWVGTASGKVFQYSRSEKKFLHQKQWQFGSEVKNFFEDERGHLWVVARDEIARYRFSSKDTRHFVPEAQNGFVTGKINCGMTDKYGVMWFGTDAGGILKYDDHRQRFISQKVSEGQGFTNKDVVWAVFKDKHGNYFAGTEGGIFYIDPSKDKTVKIPLPEGYEDVNTFTGFFEISEDEIAVGFSGRGLWKINLSKNILERAYDTLSLRQSVFALKKDKKGNIWFAANNCIAKMKIDPQTGKKSFHYFHRKGKRFVYQPTMSLHEDKFGNFWFASPDSGLIKARKDAEDRLYDFTYFSSREDDSTTLSHNYIFHSALDRDGKTLWVAAANGLNRFDTETGKAERLGEFYEQANLPIYAILQDANGVLWMSSNVGIIKFDPHKQQFSTFTSRDGLQSNEFNQFAFCQTGDGEMIFGGVRGFNTFNPSEFTPNHVLPRVIITDFKIFNQKIFPGGESPLTEDISSCKKIELNHKQYIFSFEFVGLSFRLSDKNQYAYIMEGFDKEWNFVGGRRFATYSNLPAGEYVFKVKAANNDGVWNESGASVIVVIHPPFWKTTWFIASAIILILFSAYFWYRRRVAYIHAQKKVLEKIVAKRTTELQMQKEELSVTLDVVNEQKARIEEMNNDFIAGLTAALRIQVATLPFTTRLDRQIGEGKYFIFYKPRDIVSGDFYWFDIVEDCHILIVADCTGHGVPGAFMSMIGMNLLEEVVKSRKTTTPSQILEAMHNGVRYSLGQNNSTDVFESMDMLVLARKKGENKITYSGAMLPLYYFCGGEIFEQKAAKKSVGGAEHHTDEAYYDTEIILAEKTVFYLTTDGFKDQFGGLNRKKFMAKNLKNLFHSVGHLPLEKQKSIIEKSFNDWITVSDEAQTDDVTVLAWELEPVKSAD